MIDTVRTAQRMALWRRWQLYVRLATFSNRPKRDNRKLRSQRIGTIYAPNVREAMSLAKVVMKQVKSAFGQHCRLERLAETPPSSGELHEWLGEIRSYRTLPPSERDPLWLPKCGPVVDLRGHPLVCFVATSAR